VAELIGGKVEMKKAETRDLTIRGIILPTEWDKHGHVTSIGIETEDNKDYIIFLDKIGEKLFKLVDRKVEVTGTVKNVYGDLVFTVHNYALLGDDVTEH
jgi:hypothetical protein